MQFDLLLPNLTNIWYKEPLAIRPASTQPDKYMVQNTAYSTTCFYLNWQMYGLSNYDDCEFVLVLFYQKKLSSSNNANQKSSWLYRFFFGLPLSLYIMKALMMTTLMRKCSRYFHYFRLCLPMLYYDCNWQKGYPPENGFANLQLIGVCERPDWPVLEFSWDRGTFLQRREVCD